MVSLKGIFLFIIGLSLFVAPKSNAQTQAFFNCVSQMTPVCDLKGHTC